MESHNQRRKMLMPEERWDRGTGERKSTQSYARVTSILDLEV